MSRVWNTRGCGGSDERRGEFRGIPCLQNRETWGTHCLWLGEKEQKQEQPRALRLPTVAQEDRFTVGVRGIPCLQNRETWGTHCLWLGEKEQKQEQPRVLRLPAVAQEDSPWCGGDRWIGNLVSRPNKLGRGTLTDGAPAADALSQRWLVRKR